MEWKLVLLLVVLLLPFCVNCVHPSTPGIALRYSPAILRAFNPNIVFNVVYIPPNANDSDVTEQLVSIVQEQEDRWPDAAVYVLGDFNHVTLRDHLPHFSQHVTVPTRKEKTIDLCNSNTPDSYKSYQLPCLGDSDHNMVHICPKSLDGCDVMAFSDLRKRGYVGLISSLRPIPIQLRGHIRDGAGDNSNHAAIL
ncbi:endonuclease domain of the non-LTR retrotransposon LINE-1 [Elysia marginata]|uniref:Endonuclease domain of the non-LTR retrotransposon LINE-1 n=1 Tax=Elysia marginata TaxID=1093978 RepID=A0AAV4HTB4_9GAST|nr:endonuclease domain of the non-LTR retrotransposon LINE-1 [Elysia marginata]